MGFYQVIVFEGKVIKPLLLKSKVANELFVFETFFAVYKEGKLYYYQEIKNDFNLDELKQFIRKRLFIDEIQISYAKKASFNEEENNEHHLIKPIKSRLFRYYLIYLILICTSLYFFEFYKVNQYHPLTNLRNQTEQIKLNQNFLYISEYILNVYEKSKEKRVFIDSFSIKNAKIIIDINSKNKKYIYDFLNEFENTNIKSIYFDEKLKRFITNASFKIHRR